MADQTQSLSLDRAHSALAPAGPVLFLVLQGDRLLQPSLRLRLGGIASLKIGRADELRVLEEEEDGEPVLSLGLPDARVSTAHCLLRPFEGGFRIEDGGSKNGTFLGGRQTKSAVLEDGDVIEAGRTFLLYRASCSTLEGEGRVVKAESELRDLGLASLLPPLALELQGLRAIAASAVPVVVRGESGTGKELIAAAVHQLSGRSGAFVPVNCGALHGNLLAAEMFGHKKGSFTGAGEDRLGLVRAADRGTLFLDEVGDLPLDGQAALLRVLQENEVLPLGATKAIKVDVRVVAATHRDLERMVQRGQFRADLLSRLQGFTLHLPPLRERRCDLGVVLAGILRRRLPERSARLKLGNRAARALLADDWPLNVRALEKAILTADALSKDGSIELISLPAGVREGKATRAAAQAAVADPASLEAQLRELLTQHQGNLSAVAAALGKDRVQIRRWMKKLGLDAAAFREGGKSEE